MIRTVIFGLGRYDGGLRELCSRRGIPEIV